MGKGSRVRIFSPLLSGRALPCQDRIPGQRHIQDQCHIPSTSLSGMTYKHLLPLRSETWKEPECGPPSSDKPSQDTNTPQTGALDGAAKRTWEDADVKNQTKGLGRDHVGSRWWRRKGTQNKCLPLAAGKAFPQTTGFVSSSWLHG